MNQINSVNIQNVCSREIASLHVCSGLFSLLDAQQNMDQSIEPSMSLFLKQPHPRWSLMAPFQSRLPLCLQTHRRLWKRDNSILVHANMMTDKSGKKVKLWSSHDFLALSPTGSLNHFFIVIIFLPSSIPLIFSKSLLSCPKDFMIYYAFQSFM